MRCSEHQATPSRSSIDPIQSMASAVATTTKKMITLKSSDGEEFEVEEAVAMESQTIRHMIEYDCAENGIPLPNVTSKILSKVIKYCKKHVDAAAKTSVDDLVLKAWDAEFVKVEQTTLFDLILAADYLNIEGLLHLTMRTVVNMMEEKNTVELRKTFNIKNDFTPEEEEEHRRDNPWAFEIRRDEQAEIGTLYPCGLRNRGNG